MIICIRTKASLQRSSLFVIRELNFGANDGGGLLCLSLACVLPDGSMLQLGCLERQTFWSSLAGHVFSFPKIDLAFWIWQISERACCGFHLFRKLLFFGIITFWFWRRSLALLISFLFISSTLAYFCSSLGVRPRLKGSEASAAGLFWLYSCLWWQTSRWQGPGFKCVLNLEHIRCGDCLKFSLSPCQYWCWK